MEKEVFDQNLDEMMEFDSGLDVNAVLEATPALETTPEKKEVVEKVEDKSGKPKDVSLKNINKVLDEQSTELDKDKQIVEEKVEEIKTDDKASASLVTPTEQTSSDAPFTVIFARDLAAQGLLSSFNEEQFGKDSKELGEAEALRNLIRTEIDANITAAKEDLDAGYQEYLTMIGKGVPQESAGNLIDLKARFDAIKIDELAKEENVELRKKVMTDYYKLTTSLSDKAINKHVQSSVDLGDDIEESKEFHTILKKLVDDQIAEETEEASRQQKLAVEENRRSIESLKENINSLSEVIPGVPINKQTKVQMFESITKAVQDKQGRTTNAIWAKRSEDPMFFDERLAYLFATGFFEKNKPWTKVADVKVTKTISDLEKAIEKGKNTGGTVGAPVIRTPEQEKTARDNIDSMRGLFK